MNSALLALFFGCITLALANVEVRSIDPENAISSQYIVVFKTGTTDLQIASHMKDLTTGFETDSFDNKFLSTYQIGTFQGFSAKLSPSLLETQKASPLVAYIEQDAKISAFQSCSQQTGATWGIDRVGERAVNLDGNYNYPSSSGEGVDAYIVDTGININHIDFDTRGVWGANFVDTNNADCNGHGTHVAGTVGGTKYGVAKKSTVIAVKVLNCAGSGSYEGVISGVQYVATSANQRKKPSTANMSLGGPISDALDDAIDAAVAGGVTFVVAAGNSNDNACYYSPANTKSSICVGATGVDSNAGTQVDNRAYFSNYGSCVTIFAPGLMIESDWIGPNNNEITTISGTSMASPHVCGITALYLGSNPSASPADVEAWLLDNASTEIVDLECAGARSAALCNASPNVFSYSPCA